MCGLMKVKSVKTFTVEIYIAGALMNIERICSGFCMSGLCVSVEPVNFIYTGGCESGAVVRLVNYPRFPSSPDEIRVKARALADELIAGCHQWSAMLVDQETTEWRTCRPEDGERRMP